MKIKIFTKLALLLTFSFLLVSCHEQINKNSELEHQNDLIVQSSAPLILDITTYFQGATIWINGEILTFRLYDDDFIEFDDFPLEPDKGGLEAEEVRIRKQTKISQIEVEEIKRLLLSDEFLRLKKKYRKIVSSCDAIPAVTVKSNNKNIEIVWCDSLTNPRNSPEFPRVLSNLFTKIQSIKSQALGKQTFPF